MSCLKLGCHLVACLCYCALNITWRDENDFTPQYESSSSFTLFQIFSKLIYFDETSQKQIIVIANTDELCAWIAFLCRNVFICCFQACVPIEHTWHLYEHTRRLFVEFTVTCRSNVCYIKAFVIWSTLSRQYKSGRTQHWKIHSQPSDVTGDRPQIYTLKKIENMSVECSRSGRLSWILSVLMKLSESILHLW